ncbi:MAG: hypothetical protein KDB72_03385 [Mycobacterium sp.]|nr:hypothetical protein [Mycobacterium sp.]
MTQLEDDFLRRLDQEPLDANRLADRYQNLRAREELLNSQHHRLRATVERGTAASELKTLAEAMHTEYQAFLSAFSWQERGEINRFPAGYPTPWRLAQLHSDRGDLEAAGGRSPAAVYREAPEAALDGLSPPARQVVNALIDSDMSVQPLRILDDPHGYDLLGSRSIEGPFDAAETPPDPYLTQAARRISREGRQVLRAVALAAHYSGSRVLAVPATNAAHSAAHNQRYAHHVADDPRTAVARLTNGQWKPPPGALIVVDDADELASDDVRQLSRLAGRTNTKLVLVTADRAGLGTAADTRNRESRESADALQHQLPWSQHLGEPRDYQLCATAADNPGRLQRYLSNLDLIPDDIAHRQAATLLQSHQQILAAYTTLAAPPKAVQASRELEDNRQHGLCI